MNIELEVLNNVIEQTKIGNYNIINIDEVRTVIETMNRIKIEQLINKALEERVIWQGEGKDKRWKFKTNDGKLIAKTSKEAITKAYEEYIQSKEANVPKTFADLFEEWIEYREGLTGTSREQLSPSTLKRSKRDYKNYIKGTHFDNTNIDKINSLDCEKFLKEIIVKHKMTKQCAKNIASYLRGAFLYACKSDELNKNPMDFVQLKPIIGFCEVKNPSNDNRIFTEKEIAKLLSAIKLHEAASYYIQDYAIELAILTGMRVGELAGFKWSCIHDDYIEIKYSERKFEYEDKPTEYIVGGTKNYKERTFPMTAELKELFNRIKDVQKAEGISSEFVFVNANGRVSSHSISCATNRRCEEAGIELRGIHAIRRTVSSNMRTFFPSATVAEMLGHIEETNDKFYNYNVLSTQRIAKNLSKMYKSFSVA